MENDKNLNRTAKYSKEREDIEQLNKKAKKAFEQGRSKDSDLTQTIPINNNDGIDTQSYDIIKNKSVKEAPVFKSYKRRKIFNYLGYFLLAIVVLGVITFVVLKLMEII